MTGACRSDGDAGAGRSAPVEKIEVGVEVERRPAVTRWQDFVWRPCALRPGRCDMAAWTPIDATGDVVRYFAGDAEIILHRADTQVVKDNLEGRTPAVYVVLRRGVSPSGWVLHLVTVDPSEAHAHADVGADLVEALPMPEAIFCRALAFVARHHVPRKAWKRRRDPADPESLAGRRPATRRHRVQEDKRDA